MMDKFYTFEQAKDSLIDTIYTVMNERQESNIKVNGTKYRIFVTQDDFCLVWVKGGSFDCKIEDLPLSTFTLIAKELTRP